MTFSYFTYQGWFRSGVQNAIDCPLIGMIEAGSGGSYLFAAGDYGNTPKWIINGQFYHASQKGIEFDKWSMLSLSYDGSSNSECNVKCI